MAWGDAPLAGDPPARFGVAVRRRDEPGDRHVLNLGIIAEHLFLDLFFG